MEKTIPSVQQLIGQGRALAGRPKVRRGLRWFAIFMGVVGLLGFFVAPPVLKSVLLREMSAQLQREVSIERIDVNPYALSLTLGGLSVKESGGREVVGFDELYVNLSSSALFRFGVVVDELRLAGPRVSVVHLGDGRYDISDLLDKWMAPSEPSPTPRFSINNVGITGGRLTFDDRPKGVVHQIEGLSLGLPFLSSLPYHTDIVVQPHLAAKVDGAQFDFRGEATPFAQGSENRLRIDLDQLDLARFAPYLPAGLPLRLASGRLDTDLVVKFRQLPDSLSLGLEGGITLADLRLNDASGKNLLLGWKKLALALGHSELMTPQVAIDKLELDAPEVAVAVSRAGELNWLALGGAPAAKEAPAKAAQEAPAANPLRWSLGEFRLSDGLIHWRDESGAKPVQGDIRQLGFTLGPVDSTLAKPVQVAEVVWGLDFGDALRLDKGRLAGISLDLPGRRVEVAEVVAQAARLRMIRDKDGKIDWLQPPVLKAAAGKPAADTGPAWVARVGNLSVADLALRFEDRTTSPVAVQQIDGFTLKLADLSTEPGKKASLSLASRVNQKGSLKVDGSVQLTPLSAALQIESVALPLMPLQPYVSDYLTVALTRGQISSKGEVQAEMGKDGLVGGYKGSVTVGDLLTIDKLNNTDFLRWKSLYLGGIDFRLAPMAVNVGEVALSDFYSRLIIGLDGRLNVTEIVKKPAQTAADGNAAKPAAEAPTATAVASANAPAGAAAPAPAPMPIRIAKITLQGGAVNFSDFFVKPNYSVNLTRVGGRVTNISSAPDTVADLDLRGNYANSAPVQILAKLNPLAPKPFLDLKADVTGVDLVPLSPYAGKYAGYNIQKGKLSLNITYKLENNQLSADNRLFIDQLTFGDKVDSPTATSLPVNLAIALLKNNRGEIDLNLPISGSLDDPQFSIGGLVVKVIVNLFVKAVTSPFALLGSMFGGGEELSSVDFGPGRLNFPEAAVKKLEAVAKALRERDSLKLEITGHADPEADQEGLKQVAVERAVRVEKQKELLRKGQESHSVEAITLAPEEYPVFLQRAYKEARFPKPRNLIGLQRDLPVDEMEKLMLANAPASADDVRQLAARRAEAVQSWLVEQGKVPPERIFLLPPKVDGDKGKASRVDFSLK